VRITYEKLHIQAVTFDFWGTLYTNREADSIRLALLRQRLGSDGDLQQAYDYAHQVAHSHWQKEHRSLSTSERLDIMLHHLQITLSPAVKAELVRELEEALLQTPPEPVSHIRDLLLALQERDVRIGLISDTGITPGRVLRTVMARDGLLPFFQHCTFSDEVGRAKPHPRPFLHTLEMLGVEPRHATHIGDLPETDIAGAKRVGMRAVLFTGVTGLKGDTCQADAVLPSYDDVQVALRALDGE